MVKSKFFPFTQFSLQSPNIGVHHLPDEYRRGDIFVASEGTIDFSSSDSIRNEFNNILMGVAKKLKSRAWKVVYILPFGPAVLSMQLKLLVYRVCGLESIDIMNVPGADRVEISLNLRQLIIDSDKTD